MMTEEQYLAERAIIDRAEAYRQRIAPKRNWISAEEAAHPDYAACDNAMRGRVEQYEVLRDLPDRIVAYVGRDGRTITVWTGDMLGTAEPLSKTWRPSRDSGLRRYYRVRIGTRRYVGQSEGAGMSIRLRVVK